MSNEGEVRWDRLTAPALRDAVKDKTVVIIPLGATEQHGPHLPTQVDWRSAYEISLRAARLMTGRQRALVTPAIPFGMSEHHMSLGGTLTLDYATMAAVIGCVVRSAARHGFERIFVLNGHGGNIRTAPSSPLTIELKLPLGGRHLRYIAAGPFAAFSSTSPNCPACEAETSIMVLSEIGAARSPAGSCRMSAIRGQSRVPLAALKTRSAIGILGEAWAASPEKGQRLLAAISRDVADALADQRLWEAPI
jgi:creatinine amidohydrolase